MTANLLNSVVMPRPSPRAWAAALAISALLGTAPALGGGPPPARKPSRAHEKLAGADLRAADLRDTELTMTDLRRADLRGADLTGAKLDRAELADADLSGAAGLGTADFGFGIDAQRANFQRADLRNARIPGQYFEGADFRGANLRGAVLAGRFHGAQFDGADVRDAVLLGALGVEPLHADLRARGAVVTADDFARSVRGGRDYSGCPLNNLSLAGADLAGGSFRRAGLHSADLRGANLRQARCGGAVLCWAKLGGADLRGADLAGTGLTGADLTGADLSGADCRGAEFCNARLGGATLAGADLTGADLRGADLTGADVSGATLAGVRWEAAITDRLRGVTPDEQAAIDSQAARWKYELGESFDRFARAFSAPAWLIGWPAGVVVLYRCRRRAPRHPSAWLLTGLHAVAFVPAPAFLFLALAGGSPTAQLSGDPAGWSAWVAVWPVTIGVAVLGLVAFVPAAVAAWVGCVRHPAPGLRVRVAAAAGLTGVSLAAAVGVLGQLAPSA